MFQIILFYKIITYVNEIPFSEEKRKFCYGAHCPN